MKRPLSCLQRTTDDLEGQAVASLKGKTASSRRELDSRNGAEAIDTLTDCVLHRFGRLKTRTGKGHLHRQYVVRIEARLHGAQRQRRSNQESRADDEHQCEGNLEHDERRTQSAVSTAGRGAGAVAKRPAQVFPSGVQRGRDAEQSPVPIDTAAVNASTRQSSVIDDPSAPRRGNPAVLIESSARMPTIPDASPSAPPSTARRTLSVIS